LVFRQLIPEPAEVEIAELLSSLAFERRAGPERPYTVVNFIATVDGRAAFRGRSGALGNEGDKKLFFGLREHVDAVFTGTGTIRAEHYGRILGDPERRRRRVEAGRSAEPLACVVTRSGSVPTDAPLFAEPEARIVVFSPVDVDFSGCAAQIELVRIDRGELTLSTVSRRLRADFGVASLLCEGGPTVFGSLLHEDLADELFLTISPNLTGGGMEPSITAGPELAELRPLRLVWILERDQALYIRFAIG
jgi:riboflavin biosynthesis pyrimidine reductase